MDPWWCYVVAIWMHFGFIVTDLWDLDKNPYVKSLAREKNLQFTRVVQFTGRNTTPRELITPAYTSCYQKNILLLS